MEEKLMPLRNKRLRNIVFEEHPLVYLELVVEDPPEDAAVNVFAAVLLKKLICLNIDNQPANIPIFIFNIKHKKRDDLAAVSQYN
jgi:hypothetical protein